MSPSTFKVQTPMMKGDDVKSFQEYLVERFRAWNINYPLFPDGQYGAQTRAAVNTFLRAWGAESATGLTSDGVTPWLRTKIRDDRRSAKEQELFNSAERKEFRAALRKKYKLGDDFHFPIPVGALITDDWGYHPGVHDGIDLICAQGTPIYAIGKAKVTDVREGGWWGLGARPTQGHAVSEGDGIVIIELLEDVGPAKKGTRLGYGHSEHHTVKEGQIVEAGDLLGKAGWANGGHVHWMEAFNASWGAHSGRGNVDPLPLVNFLKANS